MAYIIGRGRYARETYPEAAARSLMQMGFDQPLKTLLLAPSPAPPDVSVIPRDLLTPLMVVLPSVRPGNYLEVDFSGGFVNTLQAGPTIPVLGLAAVVNFAGVITPAAPAGPWNLIVNSTTAGSSPSTGNGDTGFNGRSLSLVEIPAGATTAVVQVGYIDFGTPAYTVGGTDAPLTHPGFTLKVSEWARNVVAQPGPMFLLPF
jgi:hypothetical protein